MRGYYLATGAVDRAASRTALGVTVQQGEEREIKQGSATWMDYTFPYRRGARRNSSRKTAKLDVNNIPPEQLMRLLIALERGPRTGGGDHLAAIISPAGRTRLLAGIPHFSAMGSVFSRTAQRLFKR